MPTYFTSVPEIIGMMDFLTEVSTLYEVLPGPVFRLTASNSKASFIGVGGDGLKGRDLHDLVPRDYYTDHLEPEFRRVVEEQATVRVRLPWPFNEDSAALDVLLMPIIEDGRCAYVWVITKRDEADGDIEKMIFDDVVTGIPNRRYFMDRLGQELQRASRSGDGLTVLLLDCDHFKDINDTHGHQTGDEVLKLFSRRISHCIRDDDVLSRYGGDEFAVLIPHGSEKAGEEMASRILASLREPFMLDEQTLRLTTSIGILLAEEPHTGPDEVMKLADEALYAAKAAGKNTYAVRSVGRA